MLKPQPYKLKNQIQRYDWGAKGNHALIPQLLGFEANQNVPYAELWMGAHPKASSKIIIDGEEIELLKVIQKYPDEMLGRKTAKGFSNTLPFLFKVLSASKALSIQVHPSKKHAIALHKKDAINYPDSNQKHEIAIALDSLTALVGFKPKDQIVEALNRYPEIRNFISKPRNSVKNIITFLIRRSVSNREGLDQTIQKLTTRLAKKKSKTEVERNFLLLQKKYKSDIGLLFLFFLNLVHLKKGEAIFTKPGVPHAYLKGNILECMTNSDNVIRIGLTSKFKDPNATLKVLNFNSRKPEVIKEREKADAVSYKTEAKEFEVQIFNLNKNSVHFEKKTGPKILILIKGELRILVNENGKKKEYKYLKGESSFLPDILSDFIVTSDKSSQFVLTAVPKS